MRTFYYQTSHIVRCSLLLVCDIGLAFIASKVADDHLQEPMLVLNFLNAIIGSL